MKKLLFSFTCLLTIQCIAQNMWTQKADFGGRARAGAVSFSIGSKGFVGTGANGYDRRQDFWEYDPSTDTWTQKADFGGPGTYSTVGFSIGTKGYIGTDGNEFWEYDPAANIWTRKADFPGEPRVHPTGFSIGDKGYIGTGDAGSVYVIPKKDFWEYDPATNTWTQKADFGGEARTDATGFSIGTKGYIGTGTPDGFEDRGDFWEYDPATNTWTQKADFEGGRRKLATGFSIGTKGYLGLGISADAGLSMPDFWEFDPTNNTWNQIAYFEGSTRTSAFGFSIGAKGYVGTGEGFDYLKDFWEYAPANVLPVTLSRIKTYEKNSGVQIEWTTEQENNVDRYEVERSENGQQFSKLESIKAKGNSNVVTNYNLFDAHPFPGKNFYRIKIIDLSSKVTYSQVMKINIINSGPAMITLYPNPVVGNTVVLRMNNLQKGNYQMLLTNEIGQRIAAKMIHHPGGSATQRIETSKIFPPGVYQLKFSGEKVNIILELLKK